MHLTYNEVTLAYHKYVQLQAFFSSLLGVGAQLLQ
jgi:hypothetical protein